MNDDEKTTEIKQPSGLERAMPIIRVVKLLDFIANDLLVLPGSIATGSRSLVIAIAFVVGLIVALFVFQLCWYNKLADGRKTLFADVALGFSWLANAVLYIVNLISGGEFSWWFNLLLPFVRFCASAPFIGFELGILVRRVFKPKKDDANPPQEE